MGFNPSTASLARVLDKVGADPAANAEITVTVPAGKSWEVHSIAFTLVQGITQTPLPDIVITTPNGVRYQAPCASSAQNASVTARYFLAPGLTLGAAGAATRINAPLPLNLLLPPGSTITTVTSGLGANSNYGAPLIAGVEYG